MISEFARGSHTPRVRTEVARSAAAIVAVAAIAGSVVAPSAAADPVDRHRPAVPGSVAGQQRASANVQSTEVVNLGLSRPEARRVQHWLKQYWGYRDKIDGSLGPRSWKAFQRNLKDWGYAGPIDGVVGPGTVCALQRLLRGHGYRGPVDGIAGPQTQAAFKRFSRWVIVDK